MQNLESESTAIGTKTKVPRWTVPLSAVVLGVAIAVSTGLPWSSPSTESPRDAVKPCEERVSVGALGKVEPLGEVTRISVPAVLRNDRIERLHVRTGDRLKAGDLLAVMDSRSRLSAALEEVRQQKAVAESELAKVLAGAKKGEIEAQKENVSALREEREGKLKIQDELLGKLEAELAFAESEYARYRPLYIQGAMTASLLDAKSLAVKTASRALEQARAERLRLDTTLVSRIREAKNNLNRIAEVRPVDVRLARARVEQSKAGVEQALVRLKECYIRAPFDGQVLRMNTRTGEAVGEKGIADFGKTDRMVVVAEVYQSDAWRVRLNQPANIICEGLQRIIHGKVFQLGVEVIKQDVLGTEAETSHDRRVVEVRILVDQSDSPLLAGLSNMQVTVEIKA